MVIIKSATIVKVITMLLDQRHGIICDFVLIFTRYNYVYRILSIEKIVQYKVLIKYFMKYKVV